MCDEDTVCEDPINCPTFQAMQKQGDMIVARMQHRGRLFSKFTHDAQNGGNSLDEIEERIKSVSPA